MKDIHWVKFLPLLIIVGYYAIYVLGHNRDEQEFGSHMNAFRPRGFIFMLISIAAVICVLIYSCFVH